VWQLRISLGPDPVKLRSDNRPYYRTRSTTFRGTKTEARAERARLQAQWYPETERTDRTFGDLFRVWMGSADLASTTRQAHEMLAAKHILPAIGRTKLRHLGALDIELLYAHLLRPKSEGGAGLAPSSIRRVHAVIGSALKRAVAWKWLNQNPAEFAKAPTVHGRPATFTPTDVDLRRAVAAGRAISAEGGDKAAYAFVATAATTGMRRGELCGLMWDDIDSANGAIHVRRNVVDAGGRVEVKLPKNGQGRQVEIPPGLVTILSDYREQVGDVSPWLWSLPSGERVRPDRLTELWNEIRDRAGIDAACRLHDVRHGYATSLMEDGDEGSVIGVSGNLGHLDSSTTRKQYVVSPVSSRRLAANRIGQKVLDPPPE
jgi:integrase